MGDAVPTVGLISLWKRWMMVSCWPGAMNQSWLALHFSIRHLPCGATVSGCNPCVVYLSRSTHLTRMSEGLMGLRKKNMSFFSLLKNIKLQIPSLCKCPFIYFCLKESKMLCLWNKCMVEIISDLSGSVQSVVEDWNVGISQYETVLVMKNLS